jgi:MFS family permease
LTGYHSIEKGQALYALSFFSGRSYFNATPNRKHFQIGCSRKNAVHFFFAVNCGDLLLKFSNEYYFLVAGLFTIGMGLAGGFPIMLGIVGDQYRERLATAFSFVLLFALIVNILLNYLMGWIAKKWGIEQLSTIIFVELFFMLILSIFIYRKKTTDDGRRTTIG